MMRIAPPDTFAARASRLATLLAKRQLDALIVTSLPNIAYLTGFFASAAALIATRTEMVLIGDGRYAQALIARAEEWPFIRPVELTPGGSYDHSVLEVIQALKGLRIGFEAAHLTVRRHRFIAAALAERAWIAPLIETDGLVEELRVRKDAWEVERLRDGGERLSNVAKRILLKVLAGLSESDVATEIEREIRAAGFERPAFDTIVAAGPNAALPHGRAGRRQIEAGDLVVLDFGGVLDGYCTDLSRTVTAVRRTGGKSA
jgi:Xaa-Pro aminopeptidase